MANRKTSIIILAYKEPEKFKTMFKTLLKTTSQKRTPFEIIVIDNNCDPKIREFYLMQDVKHFRYSENMGTSLGFNQGALIATGHYICFFNSDYYMNLGWLDSMIECFEHQENIGLISCATNHTGNKDEKINIFRNPIWEQPMQADIPFDYKESECAIAQMFTTKKVWNEVDGFSEAYFPVEFEDLDFNERIKAKGYKIFVNRKTFGYHDMDKSKGKERKETRDKNRKIFYKTWGRNYIWA